MPLKESKVRQIQANRTITDEMNRQKSYEEKNTTSFQVARFFSITATVVSVIGLLGFILLDGFRMSGAEFSVEYFQENPAKMLVVLFTICLLTFVALGNEYLKVNCENNFWERWIRQKDFAFKNFSIMIITGIISLGLTVYGGVEATKKMTDKSHVIDAELESEVLELKKRRDQELANHEKGLGKSLEINEEFSEQTKAAASALPSNHRTAKKNVQMEANNIAAEASKDARALASGTSEINQRYDKKIADLRADVRWLYKRADNEANVNKFVIIALVVFVFFELGVRQIAVRYKWAFAHKMSDESNRAPIPPSGGPGGRRGTHDPYSGESHIDPNVMTPQDWGNLMNKLDQFLNHLSDQKAGQKSNIIEFKNKTQNELKNEEAIWSPQNTQVPDRQDQEGSNWTSPNGSNLNRSSGSKNGSNRGSKKGPNNGPNMTSLRGSKKSLSKREKDIRRWLNSGLTVETISAKATKAYGRGNSVSSIKRVKKDLAEKGYLVA